MNIEIDEDFRSIARAIVLENKSLHEWALIESDDMFQSGRFAGGFDATEEEFCFSFSSEEGEFWFQLPLEKMHEVAEGTILQVEARAAE